ncbi:MAG TPA: YdeI/OmpD-associated family protein [Thermoplasmata archaeon]|nr:YdeI/OmpD-associated family protein [Thermoplasmata archaeon]
MVMAGGSARPTFRAEGVLRSRGPGTWTYLDLGGRLRAAFGIRGKLRVRGSVLGKPFESTAIPWGDGSLILLVTKPLQAALGVAAGSRVSVELSPVLSARPLRPPRELAEALRRSPRSRQEYDGLAPSHRREFSEYVRAGKESATRIRRAARVVERLNASKAPRRPRDGGRRRRH